MVSKIAMNLELVIRHLLSYLYLSVRVWLDLSLMGRMNKTKQLLLLQVFEVITRVLMNKKVEVKAYTCVT